MFVRGTLFPRCKEMWLGGRGGAREGSSAEAGVLELLSGGGFAEERAAWQRG